jgi:DNA-binding MarR family transcriptional regulator
MTMLDHDVDPLALERQVCFALAVTNRAVLAVYRPLLEPLGLTHPQYLVMLALWDHQKSPSASEPMSVKQIASALQLDSATLSPMLKRLEGLGLISRSRSASDERATDVELTKAGSMISNATFQPFVVFSCVALLYFALCFPISLYAKHLERKLNVQRR